MNEKDHEIRSMALELSGNKNVIEELTAHKNLNEEQLKRLEDDLVVMTKENQLVNMELMKISKDKDAASEELAGVQAKMVSVGNNAKAKERENADLIMQYQSLNGEVNQLQLQLDAAEQTRDEAMLNVAREKQQLEAHAHVVAEKDEEIRRLEVDLRALDINSDSLARDVGTVQAQMQGACESNANLQQELRDARMAYGASEDHRRKIQSELASALDANAAFAAHTKHLEMEIEVAGQQLQLESQRSSELETLLSDMRTQLHRRTSSDNVEIPIDTPPSVSHGGDKKGNRVPLQQLSDVNGSTVSGARPIKSSVADPVYDFEREAKLLQNEAPGNLKDNMMSLGGGILMDQQLCDELQALEKVYDRMQ